MSMDSFIGDAERKERKVHLQITDAAPAYSVSNPDPYDDDEDEVDPDLEYVPPWNDGYDIVWPLERGREPFDSLGKKTREWPNLGLGLEKVGKRRGQKKDDPLVRELIEAYTIAATNTDVNSKPTGWIRYVWNPKLGGYEGFWV